jgi:uncharacterized protein YecE (DUF72 family)
MDGLPLCGAWDGSEPPAVLAKVMIRIGISGWLYPSWRGNFYPKGLPHRRELEFASRAFNTIEINGTFYSLKRPDSFRRWQEETPDDFVFALKGSRFITHMKKLVGVEQPLATFFAQGLLALGQKLGPILWQFPERQGFDETKIADFLAQLPRDTTAAAALARRRSRRIMTGRSALKPAALTPIRHAFEVRHPSFADPRFFALLRHAGAALAISDAPNWPRFEEVTADFIYIRLHGAEELYASGYDAQTLDLWAERIRRWTRRPRPLDVYVYFDNDAKLQAPIDACALADRLGLTRPGEGPRPVLERKSLPAGR